MLRVPTLELGHPMPFLVLMKADHASSGHARLFGPGRSSMYVDAGICVVKPCRA
jgi:hypothetical protein